MVRWRGGAWLRRRALGTATPGGLLQRAPLQQPQQPQQRRLQPVCARTVASRSTGGTKKGGRGPAQPDLTTHEFHQLFEVRSSRVEAAALPHYQQQSIPECIFCVFMCRGPTPPRRPAL